jgi:hypothetical protein
MYWAEYVNQGQPEKKTTRVRNSNKPFDDAEQDIKEWTKAYID